MKTLQNETISESMEPFYQNESTKLYYNAQLKIGLCEVIAPYIPMVQFMEIFNKATEMIKAHGLRHFIFDKRSLRTFHQPSMEWYFVEWKPVVRDMGMADHFKILPDEPWFHRCVEAGRSDIVKNYPEGLLNGISVRYVDSVEEAITLSRQ
jgi:hypothetical protein